ncbi:MAG: hypothetical protein QM786_00150 [Breznakibacter sp.]
MIKYCRFVDVGAEINGWNQVVFRSGHRPFEIDKVKWIGELPVLYPLSDNNFWIKWDNCGNLIFEHDLLQSAFYLLSAQQEVEIGQKDEFGRFMFQGSVQQQLNIVHKPVVNSYFKIILEAFAKFCQAQGIAFATRKPFDHFAFFLSHDIDRLYFHHPREAVGRVMQVCGLRPKEYPKGVLWRLLCKDAIYSWRFRKKDAWNNFHYLIKSSELRGIHSTFYFLPKTTNRMNSRYRLNDVDIKAIISHITSKHIEIGLHFPLSGTDDKYGYLDLLSEIAGIKLLGGRRHYLAVDYPKSFIEDSTHKVLYDSSFGFSEHEGFRNSFCFPFKPYDHANERIVDAWVVPLVAMDVTFLFKRGLQFDEIDGIIKKIVCDVVDFGGVFSLLWHNCRFDEINFPGITLFYERILDIMVQKKAQGISGREIVSTVNGLSDYSSFINDFNNGFTSNE